MIQMHVGAADVDNRPFIRGIPLITGDPIPGGGGQERTPTLRFGSLRAISSAPPAGGVDQAARSKKSKQGSVVGMMTNWLWPGIPAATHGGASFQSEASAGLSSSPLSRLGGSKRQADSQRKAVLLDSPDVGLKNISSDQSNAPKLQDLSVEVSRSTHMTLALLGRPSSLLRASAQPKGKGPVASSPPSASSASADVTQPRPIAIGSLLIRINR